MGLTAGMADALLENHSYQQIRMMYPRGMAKHLQEGGGIFVSAAILKL